MPRSSGKIFCETPTPGKKGTRIDVWKYDAIRKALRGVIPRNKKGLPFQGLTEAVSARLSPEDLRDLGSVGWYTVTVKLHLEVIGEIERVPGKGPQHLRRV